MTWVEIANLTGPPGDAATLEILERLERDTAGGYTGLAGIERHLVNTGSDVFYSHLFADADGHVAGGVKPDGRFDFSKPPTVAGAGGVVFQPVHAPGFAYVLTDRDGYVAWAITDAGETVAYKGGSSGGGVSSLQVANDALGYTETRRDRITVPGDSLSYGYFDGSAGPSSDAWPAKLQGLLGSPVTVTVQAFSGWCVDEVSILCGALEVPLTVAGGQIPASGPVTVTTSTVIGWRPSVTRTFTGSLGGVPGVLTRDGSDTEFTFTRTTAGSAVTVPDGTVFVPANAGNDDEIMVILIGRNDLTFGVTGTAGSPVEHVIAGIRRLEQWQSRDKKKVLVLSVTNKMSETSGTSGYAQVVEVNAALEAAFGPRFLDIRAKLIHEAMSALGITPTSADLAQVAADAPPRSVMDGGVDGTGDDTHWSREAHTYVAGLIHKYLTDRDWTD